MHAIAVTDPSSAPELVELPDPAPQAGEVRVRVRASSLNGFDIAVAAGMLREMMEHRYPVVLGMDFAGEVDSVGENVTRFAVGDPVFGVALKDYVGDGAAAEYLIMPEQAGIETIPAGLAESDAGALGLAGSAALGALAAAELHPGDTLLIVGATGGVGSFAIQYAVAAGIRVIATARSEAGAELVRSLGADEVVDPGADLAAAVRPLAPGGVPAALHLAGDPTALLGLLAPGGRVVSLLGFGAEQHPAAVSVIANPDPATLHRLAADVVAGRLRVPISTTVPLAETPAAVAAFPTGTVGKHAISVA